MITDESLSVQTGDNVTEIRVGVILLAGSGTPYDGYRTGKFVSITLGLTTHPLPSTTMIQYNDKIKLTTYAIG
jgi:hypothetical protein